MAAITELPSRLHRTQAKTKLLQTQVPVFKEQQQKYNEFELLVLNHIRPFQNVLKEEKNVQVFVNLLRGDVIEFWQTLHILLETTSQYVLTKLRKELARRALQKSLTVKIESTQI